MRIAVVGDLQYSNEGPIGIAEAFEDINRLSADAVVFLGDYGVGKEFGTPKSILDVCQLSKLLKAPKIYPILGNHDMALEAGKNKLPHGTIAKVLCDAYGLDSANYVVEYDDFRLVLFGIEPQPEDDFDNKNECYLSPESFERLNAILNERKDVPVIMFTHAQPIFGGLRTVPKVHVRATNAYLDQNHNPAKWLKLAKEHPQILMWFCGHYHIGHHYPNSATSRYGIDFYLTGVLTVASRDGSRHSRIIDINDNVFKVSTLDHNTGNLVLDKEYPKDALKNKKHSDIHKYSFDFDGYGKVLKLLETEGKQYILTDDYYVWELNLELGVVMGTLNCSDTFKPSNIYLKDGLVWCSDGKKARGFNPNDNLRFMKSMDGPCSYTEKDDE